MSAGWVFEGPDPEVGIFGDLVVHTCEANTEEEQAEEIDETATRTEDGHVKVTKTFRCPACAEQTEASDLYPAEWFEGAS